MKLDENVKFGKQGTAFTGSKGIVIKPWKRLCIPRAPKLAMKLAN